MTSLREHGLEVVGLDALNAPSCGREDLVDAVPPRGVGAAPSAGALRHRLRPEEKDASPPPELPPREPSELVE